MSCSSNVTNCHYCHIECNGCTGSTNRDCVSCRGLVRTNSQGQEVCAPNCNANEYLSEKNGEFFCFACHPQCSGCTGPANTQCSHCRNVNNTFTSDNECIAACPYGSYSDDNNKCRACDPQCNGCSGPSSSNCSVCMEESITQTNGESVCVPSCPLWQIYDLSSSSCALTK